MEDTGWVEVTLTTPFDALVASARIKRLEESLRVCTAEKELLEQERDMALYRIEELERR